MLLEEVDGRNFCLAPRAAYCNHVDALREQLTRAPKPFPKLEIANADGVRNIQDIKMDNLRIVGYEHHPKLPMKMAV